MSVTIIIPISREDHLARLFHSLEMLSCDVTTTNLFCYVDGPPALFVKTRNYTQASKLNEKLCIEGTQTGDVINLDRPTRRLRISNIHNDIKRHLDKSEYLLLLEDDTIIPPNALARLLTVYGTHPYAGFVSGVEVGRWGITHLGLWSADDVYEPTVVNSLPLGEGVQEVDAAGLYCCLVKREYYLGHEFKPFGDNDLGPDVDFGFALRKQGLKNYVDFSVQCEHRIRAEVITVAGSEIKQVTISKEAQAWSRKIT